MTDAAADFAKASSELWKKLVEMCRDGWPPVEQYSPKSLVAKMRAIRHARDVGVAWEQIAADGQYVTLKRWHQARAKYFEKRRRISMLVSASLADAFECENPSPDAEEPLMTRFQRVCGFKTYNDVLEYLNAHFGHMSDLELRHDAGEISHDQIPRKKRKHAKT